MITHLLAPAKLTVTLRMTGVRGDGYHLIDAEMVSLDLANEITIDSERSGLVISGAPEIDTGPDNLVSQALRLAEARAHVTVDKHIPPGAGLGGGSTDAAAVLRWAGFDDAVAAASIGADVAFCLAGGRARVTGIGEQLEPLPYEERTYTLLTPPFGCPTIEVYRRWDELGGPDGDHGNDLEPAAIDLVPEMAVYRDLLGDLSGMTPRLAGSGSTWFVEGEVGAAETDDRLVVARTVPARWGGDVEVGDNPPAGASA